jgi:hypothetical protein
MMKAATDPDDDRDPFLYPLKARYNAAISAIGYTSGIVMLLSITKARSEIPAVMRGEDLKKFSKVLHVASIISGPFVQSISTFLTSHLYLQHPQCQSHLEAEGLQRPAAQRR